MQLIIRTVWCITAATVYQIATNPFVLAVLLCLPYLVAVLPWWAAWPFFWVVWDGHALAAALLTAAYTIGCVGAVMTSKVMHSPLTGFPIINTPRSSLFWIFGNDQDGLWVDWHRAKYSPRLRWLAPFMWTWWRNKLRNLPFVPGLQWLHRVPDTPEVWRFWKVRGVLVELYWCGWMTELKWSAGNHFGDIGPRLDQPVTWGAVSWAFRPIGRA